MTLLEAAGEMLSDLVDVRRRLHRQPELGLDLPRTQAIVAGALEALGLKVRLGRGLSSATAVLGPELPGRAVILRADMDGLRLTEATGLDFASEVPGLMHACGHDLHVAMLLGCARMLCERLEADPSALPGPVVLMFQPGEEGFFGARAMIEEGLLDGLDPATTRAFSLHVLTRFQSGEVHLRAGAFLASADEFSITVRGRGGHASTPHLAADPIPVAAEIVTALQSTVTRSIDAMDPVVLTVGHLTAGTTHNVIPETATLEGTVRCVAEARRAAIPNLIRRVADGVASAHGLSAEVTFDRGYPVTENDPDAVDRVRSIAADLVGGDDVHTMPAPLMNSDDWSYIQQRVSGAYVFLGARPREADPVNYPLNHSNHVVYDERAMAVGAALYAKVALEI